jgi:uncharacterized membrane protein
MAKALLAAVACLIAADLAWISNAKPMYARLVENVQGKRMSVDVSSALIAYVFVVAAFVCLVGPRVDSHKSYSSAFFNGALVGLIVYAIFNATNKAMFIDYDMVPACIDTIWGTLVFGSGAVIYRFFL